MPPLTTDAVTGPFTPAANRATAKEAPVDIFSSEGFLRILASQISNQNPLEPMSDTEYIAQMAQFSQLEQTTNMARDIRALALSSRLAEGSALIGRTVSYAPAGGADPVTGVVERLRVAGDGSMALVVNGVEVDPGLVTEVRP
ncbi:flagellar hook capping FlgD N-terminal domain-containing protein [Miltoncostaea marina]|uniref:flagellar hook capping FlgD N-terminal domain-containing protein n=1 Tax=Miltoncostaea marina TaxID=2843215 RepID=UPI001C3D9130|nr:flagellar hook capping FlgD N-terminal domain-containing protein [Miltoncostaea marina]